MMAGAECEGLMFRQMVRRLRTDLLPLLSLVWSSPVSLVCGGHDCVPVMFQVEQEQDGTFSIRPGTRLERADRPEAEQQNNSAGLAAMKMFQARDRRGEVCVEDYRLLTTHQKTITEVRRLEEGVFSTAGGDGRLCVWRCPSLQSDLLSHQMENCQL